MNRGSCHNIPLTLTCSWLIHIVVTSAYELPTNYFINCGSEASANHFGQDYAADSPANSSFSFSPAETSALRINPYSDSVPLLYQTARVHTHPFSYQFGITQKSTHFILRLHFRAFSSAPPLTTLNLSDAIFDVSISGTRLLSNFSTPSPTSSIIHEFVIPMMESRMFQIDFTPLLSSSPLAFINAIEAFSAPDNLISSNNTPHLVTRHPQLYKGLGLKMHHNIHRINMGGGQLTPQNDTLLRYWKNDDDYLYLPEAAKNVSFRSQKPEWNSTLSDQFIAPDLLYQTAEELNFDSSRLANSFNMTWNFHVAENAKHFVRAHFCDIIGDSIGNINFNFYIDGYYSYQVVPRQIAYSLAVPFYIDFVVDSDESGFMNISVGSRRESVNKAAFLNGLEIMEVMDAPRSGRQRQNKTLLVSVAAGGLLLIFILFSGLFFVIYLRKVVRRWQENDGSASSCIGLVEASTTPSPLSNFKLGLKIPIAEIMYATNNFDANLMIGEGGFGKVYKGRLQDGTKVAVKRSEPGHGQGMPEFQTEIIILSKIRHKHLVSLIGFCDEMWEMILVYELMENGTLREHLYGDSEDDLSWEKRLEICIGAARGLHYLHAGAVDGIIHRDVKSTNILLDGNYVAKVADFGLSSLLLDKSHVSTDIKGSFGYLDPEYFRTLQLTEKSDVYSFGVVLLEVACARPAIKESQRREEVNLADWGMLWHEKGQLQKIIDPFLVGKISPNSLRVFGETAAKCLQGEGINRPTMGEVIWHLEYSLQLQNTYTGTAAGREQHEYSTTSGSSFDLQKQMQMVMLQRLPSHNTNDMRSLTFNHSAETSASDIFSQLRIDGAR